jgi:hypothetical protein
MTFKPSSPLAAEANSISGESKIRCNEYRTSASSSINNSLLMAQEHKRNAPGGQRLISRAQPAWTSVRNDASADRR